MIVADFAITCHYELRLPATGDLDEWASRLDISETRGALSRGPETHWSGGLDTTSEVPIGRIVAKGSGESTRSRDGIYILENLRAAMDDRIEQLKDSWNHGNLLPLRDALKSPRMLVTVWIPVRNGDAAELRGPGDAKRIVMEAIEASADHWEDVESKRVSLSAEASGRRLLITGTNADMAIEAADHYLTGRRRPPRGRSRPNAPVWAWGSAAIAALSVCASFAPLTTATLIGMVLGMAVVVGLTCWLAPRQSANRLTTLLGLSVAITLVAFAAVYGAVALLEPNNFQVGSGPPHQLREPLLLSLGLLTTAGFIDFGVHGWLRSVAYLEMLLFAAFAGGAVIVAAGRASELVAGAVAELRRDRDG